MLPDVSTWVTIPAYRAGYVSSQPPSGAESWRYWFDRMLAGLVMSCVASKTTTWKPLGIDGSQLGAASGCPFRVIFGNVGCGRLDQLMICELVDISTVTSVGPAMCPPRVGGG